MSQPSANCSSCGAPVTFRWSSAVQTACPFCQSILVRTDVELKNVGKVGDLPLTPSPISLLTEGAYKGRGFQVIGRLVYEYDDGGWNEWHILFNDGQSGWLSDAQLQYAVSFQQPATKVPEQDKVRRGQTYNFSNIDFTVSTITVAKYKGFEGELPFAFYGIEETVFADLRTPGSQFGTIDYSEDEPLLFLGEWTSFDALQLKGHREFEGWM